MDNDGWYGPEGLTLEEWLRLPNFPKSEPERIEELEGRVNYLYKVIERLVNAG